MTRTPFFRSALFPLLVLAAVGFGVYGNSLGGQFLWDDEGLIQRNHLIKDVSNFPRLFTSPLRSGATIESNFYRPLQMATTMAEYRVWGLNPWGYHLTNIFFHVLAVLALFWFLRSLVSDARLAFFAALLF